MAGEKRSGIVEMHLWICSALQNVSPELTNAHLFAAM
jgi:hypothetical protein